MRLTATLAAVGLPLLVSAQDPFETVKYYLAKAQSYIPNPNLYDVAAAAAAKAAGGNIDYLSIDNFQEVIPYGSGPTWVLVTGNNKTCFGLCDGIERAYNETAVLFLAQPKTPHLTTLNCDQSPILCNAWSAGPPYLWVMDVGEKGSEIEVSKVRLNVTTCSVKTFEELYAKPELVAAADVHSGYFHPFNGKIAELGIQKPAGYFFWAFSVIPSWGFMILVSFISRTMMSRRAERMGAPPNVRGPPPPVARPAKS